MRRSWVAMTDRYGGRRVLVSRKWSGKTLADHKADRRAWTSATRATNLAAATGASTRELMARMGHSTMRAALIYQHATRERDRQIADGVSDQIAAARQAKGAEGGTGAKQSGTDLARGE
jgi:hypothetical protein